MDEHGDYLIIGKILKPFGVKGETKVLPITDDPVRFRDVEHVFLKDSSGYHRKAVEQVKMSGDRVILKLESVGSMDEAEALRNRFLYIDRQHAAPLDEPSHYYYDIQGCTVKTVQGQVLGRVHDIQNAGSCDVYVVKPEQPSDGEILVPAVSDVVKKIDTKKKEIFIEILDGLL